MILVLASLILLQAPLDFGTLGRQRADFGDKANSGPWKYVYSRQTSTCIYFPAGRANVRYYLTPVHDSGAGARLCRESKVNGVIHLDWKFEMKADHRAPSRPSRRGAGVLQILCESSGFVIPKDISRAARTALSDQRPLAGYRLESEGGFHAWFVAYDGSESSDENLDISDRSHMPKTIEAYSISLAERVFMTTEAKKIKRRN